MQNKLIDFIKTLVERLAQRLRFQLVFMDFETGTKIDKPCFTLVGDTIPKIVKKKHERKMEGNFLEDYLESHREGSHC